MQNILAIDLEDWHSLTERNISGKLPSPSDRITQQTDTLLSLLSSYGTKATFFIVGILAEQRPDLVKLIASQGHEVASHGYNHVPIYRLSPEAFKQDALRSKNFLEDLIGDQVCGYRACEFSIITSTLWALTILSDLGFTYDSSIFPIKHRRYGIPEFCREVTPYKLTNNKIIIELPLSTYRWANINWPMAGGGYFRLIPLNILYWFIKKLNEQHLPAITYFHPYEFDSQQLDSFQYFRPNDMKGLIRGWRGNFHQNIGRNSIKRKLKYLLTYMNFTTIRNYIDNTELKSAVEMSEL